MENKLHDLRHSLAHLLAAAVLELWPDAKRAIGPAIDNGFYYDFELTAPISDHDLPKVEQKMRDILKTWRTFERSDITADAARTLFADNPYKLELIDEYANQGLTLYTSGNYVDLCRGGHVENAQEINPETFKLTHIAGAYWRGSEKNKMLTRIYGLAFETKEALEKYLWQQEEAKKRDHRLLGEQLRLFTFAPEVGPGLPLWLPNGTTLRDTIENAAKQVEKKWGYVRVSTPHIAKEDLFKMSGHLPYYAGDMYPPMELDDGNYYLKAMSCPHHHMIYKSSPHSYRELPLRLAEYGTVYRHELSGTLSGLLRTRGFTQNDAHIYCREDQVEEEFLNVMKLHQFWYKDIFQIDDFYMRLSLPSKDNTKYAGDPESWEKAIAIIRRAMERSGLRYVEAQDEAAFYGPKVDFQIISAIGKEYSASTNQIDFLAPIRFNLTYKDKDGQDKLVYVVHRAPLGSHERFIAFLIEHYAGAFPVWLAPVQVAVLPIGEKHYDYALSIFDTLSSQDIRATINVENETIGKKIRNTELQKIPYILVVGDKEIEAKNIAVRRHGKGDLGSMTQEAFTAHITDEITHKK